MPTHEASAGYQPGLRAANAAPRCAHLKYNGEQCGCPALHGDTRCRFHVHADPKYAAGIPLLDDAAAIQLAIMRILRALEFGSLETKTAALMLYGLQIACSNLKRLDAAFALPAEKAEEERERSLAEELLARLDDEEFCRRVTAEQPPDTIPDIKAAAAPILHQSAPPPRPVSALVEKKTRPRPSSLAHAHSRAG